MNLKELRQQAIAKQQALVDAAKATQRELTTEEQSQFESLQREIEDLDVKIAREAQRSASEGSPDPTQMERDRCASIMNLCREFGEDAAPYITNNSTLDAVRAAILNKLKKEKDPVKTKASGDITVTKDENDKFRAAAADGLILRSGEITLDKPADGANDFRNMSLKDIAIMAMSRQGENVDSLLRMSSDEIFGKIMTERAYFSPEAAFPAILDATINKSYIEAYNHAPATFDRFCKIGSLGDFKKHDNHYLAGPAGEFKEVPENGELVHDIPKDAKRPQRQLRTYGRQFTMSRKAFINDDIGFITTLPGRYARSARMTINKQVYEILFKNPTIYDGVALFEKTRHRNLLNAGTAPTAEVINKMILALSTQKDDFDEAIIAKPSAFVTPVGYAMDFYKLFNSPSIQTTDNTQAANPLYQLRNNIEIVEDATLNALAGTGAAPWFLFAGYNDLATLQVDFLNGQQTPNIRRMEVPGVLGYVWDIFLDWGITAMDFRGVVKNPGVVIASPLD